MSNERKMGVSRKNEGAIVRMLIQSAKIDKLPSEMVQNSIEHEASYSKIDLTTIGGVEKLTFTDDGCGMTPRQMEENLLDLYSSSKTTGIKDNRGIGARVTALRASPNGVFFDSCIGTSEGGDGIVTRATLRDNGVDIDVSTLRLRAKPRANSFTRVTLMGASDKSDSLADVYPRNGFLGLVRDLHKTFFRFPKGFKVTTPGRSVTSFEGTWSDSIITTQSDCGNVLFHWVDARGLGLKNEANRSMLRVGHFRVPQVGGVVFQNRLFDLAIGKPEWRAQSKFHQLTLVSEEVMLFVELDDSYPVSPSQNRDSLQYIESINNREMSSTVQLKHFGDQSEKHQPKWVSDLIEERRKELSKTPSARKQFLKLAELLNLFKPLNVLDSKGDETSGATDGDEQVKPVKDHSETKRERESAKGEGNNPSSKKMKLLELGVEFQIVWPDEAIFHRVCDYGGKAINAEEFYSSRECLPTIYVNGSDPILKQLHDVGASHVDPDFISEYRGQLAKIVQEKVLNYYWITCIKLAMSAQETDANFRERMAESDHATALYACVGLLSDDVSSQLGKSMEIKTSAREEAK